MKKLGLCVRYDCNNYGSMLQILATQKVIERAGWSYEIIRYDKKTVAFILKNIPRLFNPYFVSGKRMDFLKKMKMKKHPEINEANKRRLNRFAEYRKEYIGPYSAVYKGYSNLVKASANYDAVMVGSDQLWTPAGIQSRFYNLLFVKDEIRKISFATSFGVVEVPNNQKKLTTQYLNRIDCLSVRENSGAELVKKLTGRDAVVALDPTLLLTGEEWEEIFPNKTSEREPYIFAYFLGKESMHRAQVEKLAKEKNIKIITCPHMDEFVEADLQFGTEQRFDVGPVDFLNLIRNAEYVCTDSFHGTVFSILNHKKFVTFDRYSDELRKSKNSRIKSLFELLGLEKRHFVDQFQNILAVADGKINYDSVEEKLGKLRKESLDFLDKALND